MPGVQWIRKPVKLAVLKGLAEYTYGDFVKIVVDIERQIMMAGMEFHSDVLTTMLADGSQREDVWGARLFPAKPVNTRLNFTSPTLNIQPKLGNTSEVIRDPILRRRIQQVVDGLILE